MRTKFSPGQERLTGFSAWIAATVFTGSAFLLRWLLHPFLGDHMPFTLFLPAVMASTWTGGIRTGLFSTLAGALLALRFFIPPDESLLPATSTAAIGTIVYLLVSGLCILLTELYWSTRRQATASRRAASLSQARLAELLGSINDGFVALDPEWRLTWVNENALELSGHRNGPPTGGLFWKEFPAFDTPEARTVFEHAMTDRVRGRIEVHDRRLQRWLEARVFPSDDGGVTGYLTDITDRRTSEMALQADRKQTEDILSSIQESLIVLDREWRIVWANGRVCERLGKTPLELVGRHLFDVAPEARGSGFETGYAKVLAERKPHRFEVHYTSSDRWYEVHAYPTEEGGLSAYVLDISDRRLAELNLRRREIELRTVTDNAPALISYISPDGSYRWVNRRYAEFFGATAQITGKHVRDVLGAAAWQRIEPLFTRALSGEMVTYSIRVQGQDGLMHDFSVTLTPVMSESGFLEGLIALAQDVTERIRTEASLRASEERYRFLAEGVPQLVWSRDHNGTVDYVNRNWLTYTGLTFEDAQQERWREIIHPDDVEPLQRASQGRINGTSYEIEIRLRRASDGAWRWHLARGQQVQETGSNVHWIGTAIDIHDRKEAEVAIAASEKRYSTLARALPALVWSADAHGRPTWFSEQWVDYAGRVPSAVPGPGGFTLIHPEDAEDCAKAWQTSVASVQPFEAEFRLRSKDGSYRWYLGRALPVRDGSGAVQWIGTSTDIDARRRAEQAVRNTNERLTAFIQACPLAVTVVDPDGTVRLWSRGAEQLYGWSASEAVGGFSPAIVPEDRPAFRRTLSQILAGNPVLGAQTTRIRKDGTTFTGQSWMAEVTAADGSRQVISIVADVTERLRAEAAIRETEQRFHRMADQAPVLVWIACSDRQVNWLNKPWHDFTGRGADQEYGRGWLSGVHPDDRERWQQTSSQAWSNRESYKLEFRLRRHDGEFRWILGHGVPLVAADGAFSGYIGSCVDITERRQAELARQRSEERLRLAMIAAGISTWDLDLRTNTVQWATGISGITDAAEGSVSLEEALAATHPDDLDRVKAALDATAQDGVPFECEYRIVQADGEICWLFNKGKAIRNGGGAVSRVIGVTVDVTARRTADQALRESEQRLRLAKEAAELGIWDWDLVAGTITWSPEMYTFTGVDPEAMLPYDFAAFAHPDDRERVTELAENAVASGELLSTEYRVVRPDGSVRWLLTRGRAVHDENGRVVRIIGLNMDVTDRRETEEKLRRSNAELEQYAFAASHDLQEPLRVVLLYSELLMRRFGTEFDEEARMYFRNINMGAVRMKALIEDLISYSRILATDYERRFAPVDLNAVLKDASDACRAAIEESSAEIRTPRELPVVYGDHNALAGVLQNLISNAVKYRRPETSPKITIDASREGGSWHISVRDNGIGIRPVYHERIFRVFKRLHGREVPGTGIGLAICKRTVEQHGGRIWVESREGEGATFHFTLPALTDSQAELAASAQ